MAFNSLRVFPLLFFAILTFFYVSGEDIPCTTTNNETKNYYDLRKLVRESGEDWLVEGLNAGYSFQLNICHKLLTPLDISEESGASGKKEDKNYSLGKANTMLFFQGERLLLEYKEGDKCGEFNQTRKTLISFSCDNTITDLGKPKFVHNPDDCNFWFDWSTPAACPIKKEGEGMSGWGVFFTIFFIALLVYFVGGVVYNRMVHNAVGLNQIPNWEFWSNAWDFLKDMFDLLLAKFTNFNTSRPPRNYRNLPGDEEHVLIDEDFEER